MDNGTSRRSPLVVAIVGASCCLALFLALAVTGVGTAVFVRSTTAPGSSADPLEDPDPDRGGPAAGPEPEVPGPDDPGTDGTGATGTEETGTEETGTGETEPSGDAPEEPAAEVAPPPGVSAKQPYLELSTSDDGPVVDVYIDFFCPPCTTFYQVNGDDLTAAALSSEITLRVHPRPMLDHTSEPQGYSGRAANASVCAFAEKPEWWFPAAIALFEHQPETAGLSDQELIDLLTEAEIGGDVSGCITHATYLPWLEQVVEPEALEAVPGAPAVLIDGELFEDGLYTEGALKTAFETA